jgi:hypothetical protein
MGLKAVVFRRSTLNINLGVGVGVGVGTGVGVGVGVGVGTDKSNHQVPKQRQPFKCVPSYQTATEGGCTWKGGPVSIPEHATSTLSSNYILPQIDMVQVLEAKCNAGPERFFTHSTSAS